MNSTLFGHWLKEQRATRRLKQSELETAATLATGYVSKLERGKTKLPEEDTRARIHEALGTSEDDLVGAGVLRKVEHDGNVVYLPQMESAQQPLPVTIERQAIRELEARYDARTIHERLHALISRMTEQQATALLLMLEVFEDAQNLSDAP